MNVDRRGQPYGEVIFFYFLRTSGSNLKNKFRIPGAGKKRCAWPCSCADTALRSNTKSGRTICGHDRRNAVFRQVSKAEGICNAGVWLTAEEMDQIVVT